MNNEGAKIEERQTKKGKRLQKEKEISKGVFQGVAVSRDYRKDRSVSGQSSKRQKKTRPVGEKLLENSLARYEGGSC